MLLAGKKVGFAFTGSFCTFEKTIPQISRLIEEGAEILPIMSFNSYNLDTKFGKAKDYIKQIEEITGNKIINTIEGAEPIGPKGLTDVMVIAPCSRKYGAVKWQMG
jgi:dipicolinate synthase subunit B